MVTAAYLKSTKYWGTPDEPRTPFAKQVAFMLLPHQQALYGGAAGGAKSECLLMSALQWVDIPGYSALIIRRNITDLKMPGNLLDRATKWLKPHPEVRFDGSNHTYYFPTKRRNGLSGEPAKLTFGFLSKERSVDRYKGAEFSFICFDELTQFTEAEYKYLISRLRKSLCPTHGNMVDSLCGDCQMAAMVPLKVRSGTNPGDVGHEWVKKWFSIRKDPDGVFRGHDPNRPFIPSFLHDNPFIDQASYVKSLDEQDPIVKAQLLRGDWDVAQNARFRKVWARYYTLRGSSFILEHNGAVRQFHVGQMLKCFATIDPAVSRSDYVVKDGKKRSFCSMSVWMLTPDYDLILVGHRRFRGELNIVLEQAKSLYLEFQPEYMLIETNNMGEVVKQLLATNGIKVKGISTTNDKVTNSIEAVTRMSEGRIWLPKESPYLGEWEDEVFVWTGNEDQFDDQVDCLSSAVREVSWDSFAGSRAEVQAAVTSSGSFAPFIHR